jgi:hypothetical protein
MVVLFTLQIKSTPCTLWALHSGEKFYVDINAHRSVQRIAGYHVNGKRRAVAKDDTSRSSSSPRPPMPDNDLPDDDLNF